MKLANMQLYTVIIHWRRMPPGNASDVISVAAKSPTSWKTNPSLMATWLLCDQPHGCRHRCRRQQAIHWLSAPSLDIKRRNTSFISFTNNDNLLHRSQSFIINITVDSRYLEFQGTHWNTSRYPYLDVSELREWVKQFIEQPHLTNEYHWSVY